MEPDIKYTQGREALGPFTCSQNTSCNNKRCDIYKDTLSM